ncbi:MAG TPA: AraC family transcriptional regulator [Chloroflexota bacterium]|nr:AraC family transcriptional regulator [Chloroflexota bacterium]
MTAQTKAYQVPAPDYYARARFGRIVMQPGETRGMPLQTTYQVMGIHSGEAFVRIGGRPVTHVPAGSIVLFRPQDLSPSRTIGRAPSIQSWVAASPDALTPAQMGALDVAPPLQPLSVAMDRLVSAVLDSSLHRGAAGQRDADAALLPLAIGVLMLYVQEARLAGRIAETPAFHPSVQAAREEVRLRLDQPIGLTHLAGAAHVTPEHLVRLFRRDLATTPSRYLWEQRLLAGVHLLEHTSLPIAEVATRAGFQTASHFSRAIRRHTGIRPGELRRRARASSTIGDAMLAHP